ncbi:MAG TPA: hypothetical protein VFZ11_00365 [Gemmatimonadaceae bacterium]
MTSDIRWVVARRYGAAYEADIAAAVLGAAGIEARVSGRDVVGIFGPGFGGATAQGVELLVPEDRLAEVDEVLAE